MPKLPELDLALNVNHSPHVVILGAGASVAACPRGDLNGKSVPVMANLVSVIGLSRTLSAAGIPDYNTSNFEAIYDRIASSDKHRDVCLEMEAGVLEYFADLRLPNHVTFYDLLLASLRPKDLIATFNWDPFLLQAYARNRVIRKLPNVVFLHGNVYLGYCTEDRIKGYSTQDCSKCGKPLQRSPLLFPISNKDYRSLILTGKPYTYFALAEPAKCPQCKTVVLEKTQVE